MKTEIAKIILWVILLAGLSASIFAWIKMPDDLGGEIFIIGGLVTIVSSFILYTIAVYEEDKEN
jgi:hypothetical protein